MPAVSTLRSPKEELRKRGSPRAGGRPPPPAVPMPASTTASASGIFCGNPRQQEVDLLPRRRGQDAGRLALGVAGDGPPLHQDVLARGEAYPLLLLVAHVGQVDVEEVVRPGA